MTRPQTPGTDPARAPGRGGDSASLPGARTKRFTTERRGIRKWVITDEPSGRTVLYCIPTKKAALALIKRLESLGLGDLAEMAKADGERIKAWGCWDPAHPRDPEMQQLVDIQLEILGGSDG